MILKRFIINDFTEIKGTVLIALILDCEKDIFELRMLKEVTPYFAKEMLRVLKTINEEVIFVCDHPTPTLIFIPVRFGYYDNME